MMKNHQHSKKDIFQNNILVTIVSPWAPYPGVRWSSWHQKPHPAPSQIQIIRNKTEFPQNSPSMSELLTFTGFCQNRPYNTSQNPERWHNFLERDVPQVTLLAKEGWRWYGQSRKTPVSASAMLTGKFLQIRKVFAASSLLAEEYQDTLQFPISR